VPGKGLPIGNDALVNNQKSAVSHLGKDPSLVFDANISVYTPSDPTGAVGPNHLLVDGIPGFEFLTKKAIL